MKYIIFSLLLGIGIIIPQNSFADEWSACSGSQYFNGAPCKYTSAPTNGPNGPVTKEITGFCDRAGGVSGGQFFCNKESNGWKDCFFLGDACELNGKIGVCSGTTNGSKGTCDTNQKPKNNPGGSIPETCAGSQCNSPKVCAIVNGSPKCVDSAATSDKKCAGSQCNSPKVCAIVNGSPKCVDNAATPGNPATGSTGGGANTDASAPQSVGFTNPIKFNSIPDLIAGIINALLGILGTITVAILVMSGFKYMTSSNPGEVGQALDGIKNAVVGLMIIMGAFLITQYVISALV